jgi:hypothetical protein
MTSVLTTVLVVGLNAPSLPLLPLLPLFTCACAAVPASKRGFDFMVHASISSAGVQITGHVAPHSAQARSMRRSKAGLLMWRQFQVSRKFI